MFKKVFSTLTLLGMLLAACGTSNDEQSQTSQGDMGSNEPISEDQQDQDNDSNNAEDLLTNLEMHVSVEQTDGKLVFQMELKNVGQENLEMMFSSGQQYEIVVKNDSDETVYRYSEGKAFTEALVTKEIASGESIEWNEEWNYSESVLADGNYHAELTLLPTQVNKNVIENNPFTTTESIELVSSEQLSATSDSDSDGLFRNIEVNGENGQYEVTGEIDPTVDEFFYSIEDGHNVLVNEQSIKTTGNEWYGFTINLDIPKSDLPSNGAITMVLYEKNLEDGVPLNNTFLTLDQFK
ncbi:hypothetical protein GH741_16280 [Aquibacillus halophilus]|uniref:Intracellular proteinase inhibitor BsuPI domain-containing protein n=1 Tax=Aquibacillus halophilus TaxID=930132 RepID=A0A6A8DKA1_9BACI|nr:BsuPI-related putative proteinase inhibitor [Aquibacillus halophilus]MRH44201.1 hypothetical protein [Aquibacillus halophilus]